MKRGPDWLGVGFPRCGTSGLAWSMLEHPQVAIHRLTQQRTRAFWLWKERHELDHQPMSPTCMGRWQQTFVVSGCVSGEFTTWLAATYPETRTGVVGETDCAKRIAKWAPDARFIVILREPGERAWSHWRKAEVGWGHLSWETHGTTFREAMEREVEEGPWIQSAACPTYRPMPLLQRGLYDEHLAHWFSVFPDRERTLVLFLEEYNANPQATYDRVFEHLELETVEITTHQKRNTSPAKKMSSSDRMWLDDYYRPHDERLEHILGERLPWPKK